MRPDATVLCAFHQLYKVSPTTFGIWMRLLRQDPRTVLWMLRYPPDAEPNLRTAAAYWYHILHPTRTVEWTGE